MNDKHVAIIAEAKELLRNATYADGQAVVLTQDCEALEAAIDRAEGRVPEHPDYRNAPAARKDGAA